MFQRFTNLFIFTKSERKGIIGLIGIIFVLLLVRFVLMNYNDEQSYDYSQVQSQLAELKKHQDTITTQFADSKSKYWDKKNSSKQFDKVKPENSTPRYAIDPNTASLKDWRQLGFSEKQAQSILNYRAKGAVFRKKNDLLKLFMVDEVKLKEISPFISIGSEYEYVKKDYKPFKETFKKKEYTIKPKLEVASININKADTTELQQIKGIGSYYARSIVKYRSLTGGFTSKEQFEKVYGLQDNQESIDSLTKYVWFDTSVIQKINLNTCTYEELAKVPFSTWKIAKVIVAYREAHGDFENIQDINKSDLVSDELSRKIAPYLKLHDD